AARRAPVEAVPLVAARGPRRWHLEHPVRVVRGVVRAAVGGARGRPARPLGRLAHRDLVGRVVRPDQPGRAAGAVTAGRAVTARRAVTAGRVVVAGGVVVALVVPVLAGRVVVERDVRAATGLDRL